MATSFKASLERTRTRLVILLLAVVALLVGSLAVAHRASGATLAKRLWAVVNANGTLLRSSHVTGTIHLSTGQYEVDFDRHVDNCVYVATPGSISLIEVKSRTGNVNGVFVGTEDTTATFVDTPFHLLVTCPGT